MHRRELLKLLAAGTLSITTGATKALAATPRRQVSLGGRRIRVVDIHGHCVIPETAALVAGSPLEAAVKGLLNTPNLILDDMRVQYLDREGIDTQVLSTNPWWYDVDEPLARDLMRVQNDGLAAWCRTRSDRYVGLASVALQFPELAAEQLKDAVEKQGFRGVAIGGSVAGQELSDRKFDPFWAQAEASGVLIFMHPQGAPGTTQNPRLQGKGALGNTIGNPLETTVFLSHLIFEGTLDRFPGLRICTAHGGGFLASYSGRSDAVCDRASGGDCRALKKRPSQYFRRELLVDTMVFHESALRHLAEEVGTSQILYGTDYPFDWPVGIDFVLKASFLKDEDKAAILGGNALRLLRLG